MDMGGKMDGDGGMKMKMNMTDMMMLVNPTLKGTTECSKVPEFSLVDYSTDPALHGTSHGIAVEEGTDVLMVGLYFAD